MATNRNELLNDVEEALRLVLDGRLSCLWNAMPGIVTAVDFAKMTCSVQPAIQGTVELEDGTFRSVNLPLLVDVPIVFPGANNFILTMPLAVNDEVLVVFASRCIDAWWQQGGIQRPMEARMHDLSDGFAIPGPRSQPNVVPNISATTAQLRNKAGTTYVEIAADGKINLVSPSEVHIEAPLTSLSGNLTVGGTAVVNGNITSTTGLITSFAGFSSVAGALTVLTASIGGIPFASHVHTGVQTGPSNTGGPI